MIFYARYLQKQNESVRYLNEKENLEYFVVEISAPWFFYSYPLMIEIAFHVLTSMVADFKILSTHSFIYGRGPVTKFRDAIYYKG